MSLKAARLVLTWSAVGLWIVGILCVAVAFSVDYGGSPWLVLSWVSICEVPTVGAVLAWAWSPGRWVAEGYQRGAEDGGQGVASIRRDR